MNKKIKYICLMLLCFVATPVFAKTISSCDGVFGSNVAIDNAVPHLIHLIVTIIKIVVPVLLIIIGMIDFTKAITTKDDTLGKALKMFLKRLIAAALVFLVFAIVQLLIQAFGGDDKANLTSCLNCFVNENCSYK